MTQANLLEQAKNKVNEKDIDGALQILNNLIESDAKFVDAIYERGVLYTNIKSFDLALFDFNKLIELDQNNPFYYACRAFIKTGLKDVDGAIKDYEYTIKLDPEDAIAYNNLGLLQEQMGFKSMAEKSFEKSNEKLGYNPNRYDEGELKTPSKKEVEEPTIEPPSKTDVLRSVFTNKGTFKEFLGFIKNGFKLKEDDES